MKAILVLILVSSALTLGLATPIAKSGFTYLGSSQPDGKSRSNANTDYFLSDYKASWSQAFSDCQDQLDGRLLSLESAAKESSVLSIISGTTVDYVWSAGQYDKDSAVWYWATNFQLFYYTNWKANVNPNTGSGFRVALYKALRPNWQSVSMSNSYRFICELEPAAEPCFQRKDLVIVLDGSGSIGPTQFETAKYFVAKLAQAFTVYDPTRISLIVYSSIYNTQVVIPLNNYLTPGQIDTTILQAIYPGASTATNYGIDLAVQQFDANKLPNVPQVMVVLTDGYSDNFLSTKNSSEIVAAKGITSFAVGIGGYNLNELNVIANYANDRVFTLDNFYNLITILAPLGKRICETV